MNCFSLTDEYEFIQASRKAVVWLALAPFCCRPAMSDAGAGATEAEVEHEKHLHRADTRRVMRNKYRKLQRQVLGTERCTRTQGLLRRHTGMCGGGHHVDGENTRGEQISIDIVLVFRPRVSAHPNIF